MFGVKGGWHEKVTVSDCFIRYIVMKINDEYGIRVTFRPSYFYLRNVVTVDCSSFSNSRVYLVTVIK